MSPRGDFSVCERCRKPGHLALFRMAEAVARPTTVGGVCHSKAIALCVGCGIATNLPRWFDSVPAAPAVMAATS